MLKSSLIGAVALCLAAGFAQAQPAAVSYPSSVSLDGFCDGITGISNLGDGVFVGTHDYTVCNENGGNYSNTAMSGPTGNKALGAGWGVSAIDDSYPQFGIAILFVINNDGTFATLVPGSDVLLKGTWSPGYPPEAATRVPRGTRLSFQR